MNSERHYPIAFKFTSVALMGFAVYIFYESSDIMIRLYAAIEFFATLNGWAASENDNSSYGDLFLLNDALCSACFFLTMLELNDGKSEHFYLFSIVIFGLYFWWNNLLTIQCPTMKSALHKYQICNAVAGGYSLFAFLVVEFANDYIFKNYVQYIGMVMWIAVLFVWYYDSYFKTIKSNDYERSHASTKKGGKR